MCQQKKGEIQMTVRKEEEREPERKSLKDRFEEESKRFEEESTDQQDFESERKRVFDHYQHYKETNEPQRFFPGAFNPELMIHELEVDNDIHTISLPTEKGIRKYDNGVYSLDNGNSLEKMIIEKLDIRAKTTYVNETIALLRNKSMKPLPPLGEYPFKHPNHINLRNGIIDIHTGTLQKHNPNFISLIQLPVSYDENATCPEIDKFLQEKLQGRPDLVKLAYQIAGLSMLQQLPFDKVFVLLGPTHTGKSTFLHLIHALLGGNNVSATTLQKLNDESLVFARSSLYGKLANTSSDLSSRYFTQDSIIKAISQGDVIEVEKKGVDSFKMRPFANLIAACNEMPKSRDNTDAWLQRLTILPWDIKHTKEDPDFLHKITTETELSGFFNQAFTNMKNALTAGQIGETIEVREEREKYQRENNQVFDFFNTFYQYDKNNIETYIFEKDLYQHYQEWAEEEGFDKPLSRNKFRKAICQILNIKRPSQPRKFENREKTYYGVTHKDTNEKYHENDNDGVLF